MAAGRLFMADKEVAALLSVHPATISRALKCKKGKVYNVLIKMKPICIGDMRRWPVKQVASVLEIDETEIQSRI